MRNIFDIKFFFGFFIEIIENIMRKEIYKYISYIIYFENALFLYITYFEMDVLKMAITIFLKSLGHSVWLADWLVFYEVAFAITF